MKDGSYSLTFKALTRARDRTWKAPGKYQGKCWLEPVRVGRRRRGKRKVMYENFVFKVLENKGKLIYPPFGYFLVFAELIYLFSSRLKGRTKFSIIESWIASSIYQSCKLAG